MEKLVKQTLFPDYSEYAISNDADIDSESSYKSSALKSDNPILTSVKRELLKRGNYYQIDNKC